MVLHVYDNNTTVMSNMPVIFVFTELRKVLSITDIGVYELNQN